MSWNYRVIRDKWVDGTQCLIVAEVYYNDADMPHMWCKTELMGNDLDELKEVISRFNEAISKPIIDASVIGEETT